MKNKILLMIAITFSYSLYAQDKKFDISLKSPDASQISKSTDMPSSTYTGVISSNIPIYNIKIDNESFPITINYHASGVKVKEVASKVGLGWSLSIGNTSLSKQIFGEEDRGWVPNIPMDENYFTPNDLQSTSYALAASITGFNQDTGNQDLYATKRDTQPDIFSYSVNGVSGEFHYDHTGKIIQIPYQKVKIENVFKITDDKGVIYNFIGGNSVRNLGGSTPTPQDIQVTDYVIESIVYPSGKKIMFEYDPISYGYLSNYTKKYSYPIQDCQTTLGNSDASAQNEYDEYPTYSEVLKEFILRKITFPEGEININYSTREDIVDGKKISSIEIKDKNQRLIQNYQFNQSYFISTEQIDVLNYSNQTSSLMKKLKLNELVETIENKKYQFQYNEDMPLPNRFSNATDYLGYYNGQSLNTGIEYVEYNNQIYGLGDNKEPNINFAKQGSLNRIKYPTGGSMDIEYENDSFYFNDYEKKISKNELIVSNTDPMQTISSQTTQTQINFKVKFLSTINPQDDGSGSLPVGPHFVGEILDANNTVVKTFLVVKDYDFLLPAQSYKVRVRKSGSVPSSEYASLELEWFDVQNPLKDYDKNVGGIRIKKIVKKDSDNTNALIQNYKYVLENNRTSGEYLGDKINYYYISTSPYGTFGNSCSRLVITNSGNANLTSINGKPVAYKRVITEVENTSGTENYKTIDYFTNYPSSNFTFAGQPFFLYANNQYARGILNKKEFYNSANNLVEKQEFDYEFDYKLNEQSADYLYSPELTIQPYVLNIIAVTLDTPTTFPYYKASFQYYRYSINSSWVKLKTQKNTRYLNNQSIATTSNYFYDTTYKHLNPTSLIINIPDSSQKTIYQYAHEKGNQKLINANIIGIPLETEVKKDNKTISKSETKYDDPANLFPTSVLSYDLQNPTVASTEVTYDRYDEKGNILQYTTKDGIPVALVWGYNKTQPIAKVEGITYDQLTSSVPVSGIVTASDNDAADPAQESLLLDALNSFRKQSALSGKLISTYTYDPLIGVTSITPPSGVRQTYTYDSANRLKETGVRGKNGAGSYINKKVSENKYNYKP
ncbi:RHS repeat domain-containing protein [Chryseobacterium gambrini]|uniref:hypothetical protein n=2 Tax=Chryseobacterium gambrini TaxID=373672 RepID=UPI0022F1C3E5|nr:hypothetical protein [Chryseobacterium gambrini]WBV52268.1 hypothetical protein PFY09_18440 [Chryseobacterium gambrini]